MELDRPTRSGRSLLITAAFVALALFLTIPGATADHQPADKVVAAGSTMEEVGPGQEVVILEASLRTSKPTDLILAVSLECSIFTELTTGTLASNTTETANAEGLVRVWIEIDGQVVPINSMSEPPQSTPPGGTDADKVTFCNREYQRTVTDQENDGQDKEEDFIRTKNSNAFNWLRLNLGSGVHTIVVKADLEVMMGDNSTAEAIIGNRSLIVEPAKLANDAEI